MSFNTRWTHCTVLSISAALLMPAALHVSFTRWVDVFWRIGGFLDWGWGVYGLKRPTHRTGHSLHETPNKRAVETKM